MKKFLAAMTVSSLVGISACGTDTSTMGDPSLMGLGSDPATMSAFSGTRVDQTAGGELNPQATGTAKIQYRGGPVMTNAINVYYIWYGNWSASDKAILTDLASSIGGTPYWNINTAYTQSDGKKVSSTVSLAGQATITNKALGTSLNDVDITSLVKVAIDGGPILDAGSMRLPADANGVYFVLADSTVTVTVASASFCTNFCSYHVYLKYLMGSTTVPLKYSFVGNPVKCMNSCAMQTTGPNGSGSVDAMASAIAGQLDQMATDPLLNAWADASGIENSEKCIWTFGTMSKAANGANYNITLGSRKYLIQQNLRLSPTQSCGMK